ncbi:MAG TPA: hypothetical protein PLL06_10935 [Acidobacteriota bacterium]|nr:hypothetical protein [Acidobacteriota bacterium]
MTFTSITGPTFTSARDLVNSCGLHVTGRGDNFYAVCPVHGKPGSDKHFTIREKDGWIQFKCWSHQCSTESILQALNLERRDLKLSPTFSTKDWKAPKPQPKFAPVTYSETRPAYVNLADYAANSTSNPIPVEAYTRAGWKDSVFVTDSGKEIPQICIPMTGGKFKYRNLSAIGGKYINGKEMNTKTWYGLARAIQLAQKLTPTQMSLPETGPSPDGLPQPVSREKRTIFHCNGESSVVVAHYYGIPAFCGLTGEASLPTVEMIQEIKDAKVEVEIILDNDDTGRNGAQALKALYQKHGVPVTVRRFNEDLPEGFDLRELCAMYKDKARKRMDEDAPVYEGTDDGKDRAWFNAAQFKFTMAFLSQLGVKPAMRMTILYILALMSGRSCGPLSNFRLGQFTGQMSDADFDDLKSDRASTRFIDAKINVSRRGKRLWGAIDLFQKKTGIQLIDRTPGGPDKTGKLVSSQVRIRFYPAMIAALEMIDKSGMKWEEKDLELSRAAREFANIELASVKVKETEKLTREEKDWVKIHKFIGWVGRRVDDGRWTEDMVNYLYSKMEDMNAKWNLIQPPEKTEAIIAAALEKEEKAFGYSAAENPGEFEDSKDSEDYGNRTDVDSGQVAGFFSDVEIKNLSLGTQDRNGERKTNGFDDAAPLPIAQADGATLHGDASEFVPRRIEEGVPVQSDHFSFLNSDLQHGAAGEIFESPNNEKNRGDESETKTNPKTAKIQTGDAPDFGPHPADEFEPGFSNGFGDIGRSLVEPVEPVRYEATEELTADDCGHDELDGLGESDGIAVDCRGEEDDEREPGDETGDASFDFADDLSGGNDDASENASDSDEELNADEIFQSASFPVVRNQVLALAPDPVALLSVAFASPDLSAPLAPTQNAKFAKRETGAETSKNGQIGDQIGPYCEKTLDANKGLTGADFSKKTQDRVLEIIGSSVHFELRKLEDALDIPPDVFLHDLQFIAEEPPETRRKYAAERFKLMMGQLTSTKWDTYYCIQENRHAVQELFGSAIRTLLKRLPEFDPPKAKDAETMANGSGLRLVSGDLMDRMTETVEVG